MAYATHPIDTSSETALTISHGLCMGREECMGRRERKGEALNSFMSNTS